MNSSVFTDGLIIRIYNEVQMQVALRTSVFERVINLSVPAICLSTRTHDWEEDYISKSSSLFYSFVSVYTTTQQWESMYEEDTVVTGGYIGTQPWEVLYASIQNRLRHFLPDDFIELLFVAYDNKPIECIYRESIGSIGASFKTNSGTRPSVYMEDKESNDFYLYPRVEVNGITEMNDDFGELVYADGSNDSLNPDVDYGVVIFSSTEMMDSNYGVLVRSQDSVNALQIIYRHIPVTLSTLTDTLEWPSWIVKYIEHRVISRLLLAETDLYNSKLSQMFHNLYEEGLGVVKKYKSKQCSMRVYKFGDLNQSGRVGRKRADLPSKYPSYWR